MCFNPVHDIPLTTPLIILFNFTGKDRTIDIITKGNIVPLLVREGITKLCFCEYFKILNETPEFQGFFKIATSTIDSESYLIKLRGDTSLNCFEFKLPFCKKPEPLPRTLIKRVISTNLPIKTLPIYVWREVRILNWQECIMKFFVKEPNKPDRFVSEFKSCACSNRPIHFVETIN